MAMDLDRYIKAYRILGTERNARYVERVREAAVYLRRRSYRAFCASAGGEADKARWTERNRAAEAFERRLIEPLQGTADPFAWVPRDGDTIHFRALSERGLPSGRYRLERQADGTCADGFRESYWLRAVAGEKLGAMSVGELVELESAGRVTVIPPQEIARDLAARVAAPLRGNRRGEMVAQNGVGGLALFRAACEPELSL